MVRRHVVLITLLFLILALNAWQWWPRGKEIPRIEGRDATAIGYRVEDFQIKIPLPGEKMAGHTGRDLFRPKVAMKPPVKRAPKPPKPPPKTPEQLAEEAARAELARIKLVGVVFRGDRGQAFMAMGDEAYFVYVGDKVGSRFIVETIAADAVEVSDPDTNVSGRIAISGK